jgi:hypothetical protein
MTNLIKRNDDLKELIIYWNHNNPSNIGLGRLTRVLGEDGIYRISKTGGRKDLALFNVRTSITINNSSPLGDSRNQLSLEPEGVRYRTDTPECVKRYIKDWVERNRTEICIQLHYLDWLERIEIKNSTLEETICILESYNYDEKEANVLFSKLSY